MKGQLIKKVIIQEIPISFAIANRGVLSLFCIVCVFLDRHYTHLLAKTSNSFGEFERNILIFGSKGICYKRSRRLRSGPCEHFAKMTIATL